MKFSATPVIYIGALFFIILHGIDWYFSDEIIRTYHETKKGLCDAGTFPMEMRSTYFCVEKSKHELLILLGWTKFLGIVVAIFGIAMQRRQ